MEAELGDSLRRELCWFALGGSELNSCHRGVVWIAAAALVVFAAPPLVYGQPGNDDFANAIQIAGSSGQAAGSNRSATSESAEPIHAGVGGGASVWWRWAAVETGVARFETSGSSFDTVIAVYLGNTVRSLTNVAANDDFNDVASQVFFPTEAGTTYFIAVDGYESDTGDIALRWKQPPPVPNDRFADSVVIGGAAGQVFGTNEGATREAGEPLQADFGAGHSVWWSWTPAARRRAVFSTLGSDFDTVLGVYTGLAVDQLTHIVTNDDFGDLHSMVFFTAEAGTTYHVVVDSFEGEMGTVQLSWRTEAPLPELACAEARSDLADARVARPILYGEDDRHEIFAESSPRIVDAWRATGALVHLSALQDNGDETWTLTGPTLQRSLFACQDERFGNQPLIARCSGFLVRSDMIATAGHCVFEALNDYRFVFGFRMLDPSTVVCTVPDELVYKIDSVVAQSLDEASGSDWALLQLTERVTHTDPLRLRPSGTIAEGAEVLVIGHPIGLPAKIADGARVLDNSRPAFFATDLDAYGGNSGSAVFNSETLEVEGILVRGELPEFVVDGECRRSRICQPGECRGEEVTRVSEFAELVARPRFVRGDANQDASINITDPIFTLNFLFASGAPPPCDDAADVDDDGRVSFGDPVRLLNGLFSSQSIPEPTQVCGSDPTDDALDCTRQGCD